MNKEIPKARQILQKLGKTKRSKDGKTYTEIPPGLILLDDSTALLNEADEYTFYGTLNCEYTINSIPEDEDLNTLQP